jgi:hypothetical protein
MHLFYDKGVCLHMSQQFRDQYLIHERRLMLLQIAFCHYMGNPTPSFGEIQAHIGNELDSIGALFLRKDQISPPLIIDYFYCVLF